MASGGGGGVGGGGGGAPKKRKHHRGGGGGGGGGGYPHHSSSNNGKRQRKAFYNLHNGKMVPENKGGSALELRIAPLPKPWSTYELAEWLDACGAPASDFVLCRTAAGMDHGYATYADASLAYAAQKLLRQCARVGKLDSASNAKNQARKLDVYVYARNVSLNTKYVQLFGRPEALPTSGDDAAANTTSTTTTSDDFVARDPRDAVAPLWRWPYANQLSAKFRTFSSAMERLTKHIAKSDGDDNNDEDDDDDATKKKMMRKKFPCPCFGIVRSPRVHWYRNKCEFTVGYDDAFQPTCGFQGGRFADGFTTITKATDVPTASKSARLYSDALSSFLRNDGQNEAKTQLPLHFRVWDKVQSCGFWRNLIVRETGMSADLEATDLSWRDYLVAPDALPAECADASQGPTATAADETITSEFGTSTGTSFGSVRPSSVMLVLVVSPAAALACVRARGLASSGSERDACRRLVTSEVQRMVDFVDRAADEAGDDVPRAGAIVVLYHDGCANCAPPNAPMEVVRDDVMAQADATTSEQNAAKERYSLSFASFTPGRGALDESLLGLRFRVSPLAFFQVNSAAANLLYRAAGDLAKEENRGDGGATEAVTADVLYDVCCGTGTIGLTLFPSPFPRLVGVELEPSAIRDAWENAARNFDAEKLRDDAVTFIAAKAEDALPKLLRDRQGGGRAVAIVDPPRSGIHHKVVSALHANREIDRLVYVSCNVETLVDNAVRLCSGEKGFVPVGCLALDLFPGTVHVEAVVVFERKKE